MSIADPRQVSRNIPNLFSVDDSSKMNYNELRVPNASNASNALNYPVIDPSISDLRPKLPHYSEWSLKNPDMWFGMVGSVLFHAFVLFILLWDASSSRPVLVNEALNEPGQIMPVVSPTPAQPEIIKAVSVNSQEVADTVNRLKQEREKVQQAEKAHQQQLANQAEAARQQRLQEEKRITQLKEESEKIAIARKKELEEQQEHLKQLALQKEQEKKNIEAMKHEQELMQKKQQEEAKKLAEVKQKQEAEKLLAEKVKAEKQKADQAKAEQAKALAAAEAAKRQAAAAHQAQIDAANQARVAGEVDKYKALIINAISRQWILPDNVNRNLSSQFRIRLAPDGGVLEVSLMRSSGDPILDRSAQSAIYKASPLPVPGDPTTFNMFREISLTVRPENIRG